MAEFKLGRIRFVWQGDWGATRAYVADDVVSFGGKSYICIKNHTSSSDFQTDFTDAIPKWDIVSDGTSWQGDWQPEFTYAPGDVVKYGSLVYIAETGHTSATFAAPDYLGLEADLDKWTPFATSFDWKGDWTIDTRFKINDLVKYGGYVYLCNTAHVSAATVTLGLEADQAKWTLFTEGLNYLGEWQTAVRYRVNDVVKYGGNVFIAITPHTSTGFVADEANWDTFIEGFQFEDSWDNATNYQIGDTVTYGGYVYLAKTNNSNAQPTASPDDWEVFTTGFSFQGDWSSLDSYKVGDVVRVGGTTYVAIADSTDEVPPNNSFWFKLNSGINWTSSTESYSQVSGTNATGQSGSGAKFDITRSKTVYTVSISTGFTGSGYVENDVITISGADVGGVTPANDIVITVTAVDGDAVDAITHTGYSSSWIAGRTYNVGDVAIYGASSFIVTATHTSETANRPDNDLDANYWNLLTLGSEALALEVEGDLVYYSNQGPTRLPIGVDGQILRATDGFPDWANYGLIDNVIYVGPLGTDTPAPDSGLTIDKPFKSVSYALDQIKQGYLNPQTRDILKHNKQFMMKEITNWLEYTYSITVTSTSAGTRRFTCASTENLQDNQPIVFTGEVFGGVVAGQTYYIDSIINSSEFRISETPAGVSFIPSDATGQMQGDLAYDAAKCERDTGLIIDAIIYDVSRGGTLNTTTATKSYYTEAGNEYISSNLGFQREQTVKANQQLKALIQTVVSNQTPVNYQSLNNIDHGLRAQQVVDFTLTAEDEGKAKLNTLMDIVIDGIEAESNTAIALPVLPNTTVFIKTGTYNEVLPMILPEYTAVVGDELRTSVVQPAPADEMLSADKPKATSALNRIKELSSELIQNVKVTPTAGNTTPQGYVNGYGGNTEGTTRINNGIEVTQDVLRTGLSIVDTMPAVGPTPTGGTGNASDAGYANAVSQIEANYDFIQEEIVAWIAVQVDGAIAPFASNFVYDADSCKRDVQYILDALRYDLTYGGNFQTTVAARSYFVDGNPVYGAGEKEETLAAYAHLKSVVGDVITETAITPSTGNSTTQDVDGTAGSAGAETFAEARVQEIYDTIDTDGTLASEIAPDTSWIGTSLTTWRSEIDTKKPEIQNSVIDYVNSNFGDFEYDSGSCRRDSTILLTSSAYDTALGTNFNSVRDGLAYRRQMGQNVIQNQLTQTVGTITAERDLAVALISDPTAITRNTAYWNEVIDIVENGTASADIIVWTDPGVDTNKATARSELQTNRTNIINALTTWINTNYPNLNYSQEICERDTGRVIDAVSYDIQYGGNSASYEAAKAYFEGYAETLPVSQRDASVAAFEQLSTIAQGYMSGATEQAEADVLIKIVSKAIEAGTIIALPTKTYPDYTWAAAGIEADADTLLADTTVVPATLQYVTNNYSTFEYNHSKCSRDVGYIVDGLEYDLLFNSTFNSLKSGMAYHRGLTSTNLVLAEQLEPSLAALDVVREEIKEITSGTQDVKDSIETIIDILVNDTTPSSYTITDPTNYDTGFFNARRLVVANKQFIIDEAEAYLVDNYNAVWVALTSAEQTQWLAEVGETVDALRYDLTYRGNLETIVTARKYYVDNIFVKPAEDKAAFLALHTRLADIIDNIATGDTGGWTKSASNVNTQDVSGTAGSAGAGAFALDRITEIRDTIDTGLFPALITPSVLWVDSELQNLKTVIDARTENIKTGAIAFIDQVYPNLTYDKVKCARDVGFIVDAIAYDIIFESDFRSSQAGLAYRRGITSTDYVLNNQLNATVETIEFIEEQLLELTIGQFAEQGSRDSSNRAYDITIGMQTIVQNGLAALPPTVFPTHTEWGTADYANTAYASASNTTGSTDTFNHAVDRIVANHTFIQDEVRHWLENPANGYDTFWSGLTTASQDACIRDVGYILDSTRYDMIYGGNTQSLVTGSAYFVNFVLTIDSSEIGATIAAYGRLKEVLSDVIQGTSVTTSPGVTEVQDTSGSSGSAEAAEFAEDRVDDVLDWINNSGPNDTIEIATDWSDKSFTDSYNQLVTRKNEIVEDVVYWVEKFHQELKYNQDTCRRDTGLMVDAIARDLLTGSNFATTKAGMAYYRQTTSAQAVINDQLKATVGSIQFLAEKVKRVAATNPTAAVELIVDDITAYINGGETPTPKWCATESSDDADVAAASIIWENKKYIVAEVIEYIAQTAPTLVYNVEDKKQEISNVIDALRYDLTYSSSSAILDTVYYYYPGRENDAFILSEAEKQATLEAYDYMKQIVSGLAVNTVSSPGAIQDVETPVLRDSLQTTGDAGSVAKVEDLMTSMYNLLRSLTDIEEITITDITSNVLTTETHNLKLGDTITFSGLNDGTVYYVKTTPTGTTFTLSEYFNGPTASFSDSPDAVIPGYPVRNASLTDVDAVLRQQFTNLTGSLDAIKTSVTEYVVENYPTLVYDNVATQANVADIIDAVGRDMMSNSNYLTTNVAKSYFYDFDPKLIGDNTNATVQTYRELKNKIGTYVNGNNLALKRTNNLMDIIINMIDNGNGQTPEINGTMTYFNDRETINAVDVLKANRNFLADEAVAWIKANYGGTVNDINGSPGTVTFTSAHNLTIGDPVVFDSDAFGGAVADTTYWVVNVTSTTTIEVSDTKGGEALTFTGGAGSSVVTYSMNDAEQRNYMIRYIDSIVYDLQYPGNHKSWKSAQLYLNAVNGSLRSDMYHVRNATGVRNMTVNGLRGNLTELNDFGTRRPTAGSYVSLDPGFGPWDTEAWVTNKSCYVQNVTTFGVGCVGCKIDGALHAGGNRSIVSNDFTQVLSDGIGVWCSGNNSLTELVSVFAYYNYSGYLADFGGRIRATNGNSSYGTFGVIAEGTDTGEEPIYAAIDNLSQDAQISNVLTDGEEEVLRFEYANAGRDYTNAEIAISGAGFNAAVIQDEFRDQAVIETRLIDLNDGNSLGGEDYVSAQNVAQGGDTLSATIAATDTALGGAYVGMNIQLTAGTGVGQYGRIISFNNGTKQAKVYKTTSEPFNISGTASANNRVFYDAGEFTQLYNNMPVYLSDDIGGLTAATVYYVVFFDGSSLELSTSEGGAAETLTNSSDNVKMYEAGWDHIIPGTPIAAGLDLTTGYRIEAAIDYTDPGFTAVDQTMATANIDYGAHTYADNKFIALQDGGTGTNISTDGITWEAGGTLPVSGSWTKVAYGGGQGATATAIVGGLGGSGAVLEAELGELNSIGLPGPTQIARVNVINGGRGYVSAPTIVFTPTAGGGGASAVATVKDGIIQEIIITSTGAGYSQAPTVTAETDKVTEIKVNSFGNGYLSVPTITLSGGGASTQASATATINNQGLATITIDVDGDDNPLRGEGYTSAPTVTITDNDAGWLAISAGSANNAFLAAGQPAATNWTGGSPIPGTAHNDIAYGNGTWVAVGGDGSGGAATSTDGSAWVSRTITTLASGTDEFIGVAYNGVNFVAISQSDETAVSSNGITWTAGGALPTATGDWVAIEYGNGRFVAIADTGEVAVSTDNGTNWRASNAGLVNITDPTFWTNIGYGQGLFVAVGENTIATSQYGLDWSRRFIDGTAEKWYGVAFGNPDNDPIWSIGNGPTSATQGLQLRLKTGAKAFGRCLDEDGSITSIRLAEPGSGYPCGTILSTTAPNTLEVSSSDNLRLNQPIVFEGISTSTSGSGAGGGGGGGGGGGYGVLNTGTGTDTTATPIGLDTETVYYIKSIVGTNITISLIKGGDAFDINTVVAEDIGDVYFKAGPEVTITDPNSTVPAAVWPRLRDGALANPTFTNRGTGYTTATAELAGDGSADLYQPSTFIAVSGLFELPEPGSNVEFANIPNAWYKLVTISNVIGQPGEYTATFQVSPGLTVLNAPRNQIRVTTTNKYSQVRLTGHDFLYIGTGNQAKTNYPFVDITTAYIEAQQLSSGGGRVFFTSTDQDGNFNVGGLFGVQQSTGTATLDADAFNLAGLQSLQLGGIAVGIGSAVITQFSTDPFFTENSDNIVPTQRAIKSYITAQIGGGQSSLNVNTLTAGVIFIANDEITTTSGGQLNIKAKMNFTGGIDGAPVALGYFLSR